MKKNWHHEEKALNNKMDIEIEELVARIDNTTPDEPVGLAPTASTRILFPAEFAEFQRVLATPGAILENCTGGTAYSFSQYNSPRHGNVIIWRANLTMGRWGWYMGVLPFRVQYHDTLLNPTQNELLHAQ